MSWDSRKFSKSLTNISGTAILLFITDCVGHSPLVSPARQWWMVQLSILSSRMPILDICRSQCLLPLPSPHLNQPPCFNDDTVFLLKENLFGQLSQATNSSQPRKMKSFSIELDRFSPPKEFG